MPRPWFDALDISHWALRLTSDEAERMRAELLSVIDRYRRDASEATAEGAERVSLVMHLLPKPAGSERICDDSSYDPAVLRPLAGVLAAMAMSLTGTRVSAIALPWFVLVTTGSAAMSGLVAFCEMAPYVLVKLFAGPQADHLGPRRVSWVADVVSAAGAGAVALLHALDLLAFPVLLGSVALIGAARGPGDLAKEMMVGRRPSVAGYRWSGPRRCRA